LRFSFLDQDWNLQLAASKKSSIILEAQVLLYLVVLLFMNIGESRQDLRNHTICTL